MNICFMKDLQNNSVPPYITTLTCENFICYTRTCDEINTAPMAMSVYCVTYEFKYPFDIFRLSFKILYLI